MGFKMANGHSGFNYLHAEYSSSDSLVEKDQINKLMVRANKEFKDMEMASGEFANF